MGANEEGGLGVAELSGNVSPRIQQALLHQMVDDVYIELRQVVARGCQRSPKETSCDRARIACRVLAQEELCQISDEFFNLPLDLLVIACMLVNPCNYGGLFLSRLY